MQRTSIFLAALLAVAATTQVQARPTQCLVAPLDSECIDVRRQNSTDEDERPRRVGVLTDDNEDDSALLARRKTTPRATRPARPAKPTRPKSTPQTSQPAATADGGGAPTWLNEAQKWVGARAKDLGVRSTLWCAAGLNKWLRSVGLGGTNSDMAASFASYGRPSSAKPGAIAVMRRGNGGGHVGIVVNDMGNSVKVLGANQGNRVSYTIYPKSRIYAYRWPGNSSGG